MSVPQIPERKPIEGASSLPFASEMDLYAKECKKEVLDFLDERSVEISREFREEAYVDAQDLGAGVSGAKKILLSEGEFVMKKPIMTKSFEENYKAAISRGALSHARVCESDDSFADFPRKERLGSLIARQFGLKVPEAELVKIGDDIASLQKFIPPSEAVTMARLESVQPSDIDYLSAMRTLCFYLITENIDGHSGNILLLNLPAVEEGEEDEGLTPAYEVIPIDFGLIFPSHEAVLKNSVSAVEEVA